MFCPSCGCDNRPGRKFCADCGAELRLACGACGSSNEPGERFCGECGNRLGDSFATVPVPQPRSYTPEHLAKRILRERTTLEGERRTVTVLFADASGFTPISERLDAEEVYALMQGCLGQMMDAVHRYEGTVTQFLGDGIMALFGAPIAHEDSPRRAVAAALEMQRSLEEYAADVKRRHPIECHFRVGLNTGPVVVGRISDDLDMEYTAIGDTVNLAARMQQAAEPGSVYISENTYRPVRDYFDCESLGALIVKGKAEPMASYRAVREKPVRTRFEAATERGLTPFVGRNQELTVLKGYLEQARRGQGQVVFVSGEAGIGKSRLLLEFNRLMSDEHVTWLEGQCISYGKNIPYLPIIDILKRNFGVEEGDNDAAIIERVEAGTSGWDEATRATVPYLRYLLSIHPGDPTVVVMDPMERRAGIFDSLRALILEESRRGPLVVVVEDLHWVDEKSEEALAALVDVVATVPVLLLLSYRPGYAHSLGERTYYSRLALGSLPVDESAAMVEGVLQASALPRQLQQLITGKAEGNPFYIEEVTKSLVESGAVSKSDGAYSLAHPIESVRVPDTIQEVILSRIDRLEGEAKECLQLASVIGREFAARLLGRISDVKTRLEDLLDDLKVLEFIHQKTYFPELSYMFKHALTHDVAYSTLLKDRRKALHRIIGYAIEELYADRLPEHYETLAHHYCEGEDWPKALDYLAKAGDKASAAYANQGALGYYARALEVCETLGDTVLDRAVSISQKRALVNFTINEFQAGIADLQRMLAAAHSTGDQAAEGFALAFRGLFEFYDHDFERARATLERAIDYGDQIGNTDVEFLARVLQFLTLRVFNHHRDAEIHRIEADRLALDTSVPFGLGLLGFASSLSSNWGGNFQEAMQNALRWRDVVGDANLLIIALHIDWAHALTLGGKGDYDEALSSLDEIVATCERIGEVAVRARSTHWAGSTASCKIMRRRYC